jgi:hypothetical protein
MHLFSEPVLNNPQGDIAIGRSLKNPSYVYYSGRGEWYGGRAYRRRALKASASLYVSYPPRHWRLFFVGTYCSTLLL